MRVHIIINIIYIVFFKMFHFRRRKMLEKKAYKNWKELCKDMNWETTRGNTKNKYLKILNSLCKYHKEGNKFIIEEIYKEPKPIEDNRGNDGIFKPLLEEMIVHRLSTGGIVVDKKLSWAITKRQLMAYCGLCNKNMSIVSYYCDLFAEELNINKDYLQELCDDFYKNNRQLMERTLTRLEKESKILIDRNRHNVIKNKEHYLATKDEEVYIMDINKKIFKQLNCKTFEEVKFKKLYFKYTKLLKEEIKGNKYEIENFYSVYVITPSTEFKQRILTATKELEYKKNINKERLEQFKDKHEDINMKLLQPFLYQAELTLLKTEGRRERLGRETQEEINIKNRSQELAVFMMVTMNIEYGYRYYVKEVKVKEELENGEENWTTKKEITKVLKPIDK